MYVLWLASRLLPCSKLRFLIRFTDVGLLTLTDLRSPRSPHLLIDANLLTDWLTDAHGSFFSLLLLMNWLTYSSILMFVFWLVFTAILLLSHLLTDWHSYYHIFTLTDTYTHADEFIASLTHISASYILSHTRDLTHEPHTSSYSTSSALHYHRPLLVVRVTTSKEVSVSVPRGLEFFHPTTPAVRSHNYILRRCYVDTS